MYCFRCGEKIYNIMKICPYCESDLTCMNELKELSKKNIYKQFVPQISIKKKKFFLNEEELIFDKNNIYRSKYEAVIKNLNSFNNYLSKDKLKASTEFDTLIENTILLLTVMAENSAQIIYTIMNEIEEQKIEREAFINTFFQKVRIESAFEEINKIVDDIDMLIQKLAERRAVQRKMKQEKHWLGGGFGVLGAIKGSVQATLLNAGSDILYTLTNTMAISCLTVHDQKVISNLKKEIYERGTVQKILTKVVTNINIENENELKKVLDEKYGKSEDSLNISTKLLELKYKIEQNEMNDEEKKKVIELYIFLLKKAPDITEIYLELYKLNNGLEVELLELAKEFGIEAFVMNEILEYEYENLKNELALIVNENAYKEKAIEGIEYIKKKLSFLSKFKLEAKKKITELEIEMKKK